MTSSANRALLMSVSTLAGPSEATTSLGVTAFATNGRVPRVNERLGYGDDVV